MTAPAAEATRGHKSAHSLAIGPVTALPFISPLGFTITPALSACKRGTTNHKKKKIEKNQ